MKLVAFDLETTGVDADKDRIVEFCFIELNEALEEQGRWSRLVNPGIKIPQETIDIHGITDDMVAEEPGFAHHASRCLLYTSPSPRDQRGSRMPSSA